MKERISNLIQESINRYLINQIKGYIDIEVGNLAYQYGLGVGYHTGHGGIDIFINDPKYCDQRSDDPLLFLKGYEDEKYDELMIGHYHQEDLLWLVTNIKDECFKLQCDLRHYLRINNIPLKEKHG